MKSAALLALPALVFGHGHMTIPPSRNGGRVEMAADCMKGECMWFSQPDAGGKTYGNDSHIATIPGEPTLNAPELRTFNVEVNGGPRDFSRYNPWRAPGSAPIIGSGCGRAGGGGVREGDGGTAKEFGLVQNMDGADLPPLSGINETVWTVGSVQEVAWAVNANHGGGYAYRLCKKGAGPYEGVSEECFQRGHLAFAGDTSEILWTDRFGANQSKTTRVPIPRVIASGNMTTPRGSMWARVPIPACRFTGADMHWPADQCQDGDCAGCCASVPAKYAGNPRYNISWWRSQDCVAFCAGNGLPGSCPDGKAQFAPPLPGLASLWSSWCWGDAPRGKGLGDSPTPGCTPGSHDANPMMKVNIVDRVVVPQNLPTGEYMLSWRWDAEQSRQVWQNCADVTIAA